MAEEEQSSNHVHKEGEKQVKEEEKKKPTLKSSPPPISLPDRSSVKAIFESCEISVPGTLALASSSPVENESDSSYRSFSQLLAGAMASPTANSLLALPVGLELKPTPIVKLSIDPTLFPVAASPSFVSGPVLLQSPGFQGQFNMTHQQALASVTAQAAQAQAQMQFHVAYPPSSSELPPNSLTQSMLVTLSPTPLRQRMPQESDENISMSGIEQHTSSDQPTSHVMVKKSSSDGYNWRKYGQKQVKSTELSRSYYKCTHSNCYVKKKVEHFSDGKVSEITYKGQHNHELPQKIRCSKANGVLSGGNSAGSENENLPEGNLDGSNPSTSRCKQSSNYETLEQQQHCSNDLGGDTGVTAQEEQGDEPEQKRRSIEQSQQTITYSMPLCKTVKEPRVIHQTSCDPESLSDGYRWRKYGQKMVKGNPNPRSYYRCTNAGCPVRKHVEKAADGVKSLLVTYEGQHNHDIPVSKKSCDQPTTALLVAAVALTAGEQSRASNPLPGPQPSEGKKSGEDCSELGNDKILESAQTLLSIGLNSNSSGTDGAPKNSNIIQQSFFNESHAAVSV